jgi:hypothetical protein
LIFTFSSFAVWSIQSSPTNCWLPLASPCRRGPFPSGGQAETVLLAVADLDVGRDLLVGHRHPVGVAVVLLGAVVDELLLHRHVGRGHEGELLGLVVLDGGTAVQRVEVVLEEPLSAKSRLA